MWDNDGIYSSTSCLTQKCSIWNTPFKTGSRFGIPFQRLDSTGNNIQTDNVSARSKMPPNILTESLHNNRMSTSDKYLTSEVKIFRTLSAPAFFSAYRNPSDRLLSKTMSNPQYSTISGINTNRIGKNYPLKMPIKRMFKGLKLDETFPENLSPSWLKKSACVTTAATSVTMIFNDYVMIPTETTFVSSCSQMKTSVICTTTAVGKVGEMADVKMVSSMKKSQVLQSGTNGVCTQIEQKDNEVISERLKSDTLLTMEEQDSSKHCTIDKLTEENLKQKAMVDKNNTMNSHNLDKVDMTKKDKKKHTILCQKGSTENIKQKRKTNKRNSKKSRFDKCSERKRNLEEKSNKNYCDVNSKYIQQTCDSNFVNSVNSDLCMNKVNKQGAVKNKSTDNVPKNGKKSKLKHEHREPKYFQHNTEIMNDENLCGITSENILLTGSKLKHCNQKSVLSNSIDIKQKLKEGYLISKKEEKKNNKKSFCQTDEKACLYNNCENKIKNCTEKLNDVNSQDTTIPNVDNGYKTKINIFDKEDSIKKNGILPNVEIYGVVTDSTVQPTKTNAFSFSVTFSDVDSDDSDIDTDWDDSSSETSDNFNLISQDELCFVRSDDPFNCSSFKFACKIVPSCVSDSKYNTEKSTTCDTEDAVKRANEKWRLLSSSSNIDADDVVDKHGKNVHFASTKELTETHNMIAWRYAYAAARIGPWEEYARDRERFQRRINECSTVVSPVLLESHRDNIYQRICGMNI